MVLKWMNTTTDDHKWFWKLRMNSAPLTRMQITAAGATMDLLA